MSEQAESNNQKESPTPLKNKLPKKPMVPKNSFSFYWIYGIIAVVLIAMQVMNFSTP